jgi:malonyl-CoA O-methyltransferase
VDDFFDGAYATSRLNMRLKFERAVSEICRVVRPWGRIIVIDKNAGHWGKSKTPQWGLLKPDGSFIAWLAVK